MTSGSSEPAPPLAAKRVVVLYTSAGQALAHASAKRREAEDLTQNAAEVSKALRGFGCSVTCLDFGHNAAALVSRLRASRAEIVFNLAEGPLSCYAKEPHAAALLELMRLPYTGNGPAPLTLCKNKATTKEILGARGVPTPRFCVHADIPKKQTALRFPLVVKPLRQDGSLGITEKSVVRNGRELQAAVARVIEGYQHEAMVEEFLGGREIHMSVVGNGTPQAPYIVLPPSEYVYHNPRWRVCTFEAKWDETHPSYAAVEAVCPARMTARLRRQLARITIHCAAIFELSGYARVDFRLDADGQPQVLEVNPNPDLAPGMGIARAAESGGLSYAEFVKMILRLGLEQGVR